MTDNEESTNDKFFRFESRLSQLERDLMNDGLCRDEWYIEIVSLLHGVTKVGTGLFYKCREGQYTKLTFESAKRKGEAEGGRDFMLLLRNSMDDGEIHDSVGITKSHFEKATGLKALTQEEYYEKCESVPQFEDIGATIIEFSGI